MPEAAIAFVIRAISLLEQPRANHASFVPQNWVRVPSRRCNAMHCDAITFDDLRLRWVNVLVSVIVRQFQSHYAQEYHGETKNLGHVHALSKKHDACHRYNGGPDRGPNLFFQAKDTDTQSLDSTNQSNQTEPNEENAVW